jgi:hypothetical protein
MARVFTSRLMDDSRRHMGGDNARRAGNPILGDRVIGIREAGDQVRIGI